MTPAAPPAATISLRIDAMVMSLQAPHDNARPSAISLPIGYRHPGADLRHQPPTPIELENAIEAIEDAVMPLARLIPPASLLVTADPLAQRLLDLAVGGHRPGSGSGNTGPLDVAAVEALFNEMVDVSQGRPSGGSPFLDGALCGYLLILREFMHHVGFGRIVVEASA